MDPDPDPDPDPDADPDPDPAAREIPSTPRFAREIPIPPSTSPWKWFTSTSRMNPSLAGFIACSGANGPSRSFHHSAASRSNFSVSHRFTVSIVDAEDSDVDALLCARARWSEDASEATRGSFALVVVVVVVVGRDRVVSAHRASADAAFRDDINARRDAPVPLSLRCGTRVFARGSGVPESPPRRATTPARVEDYATSSTRVSRNDSATTEHSGHSEERASHHFASRRRRTRWRGATPSASRRGWTSSRTTTRA